MYKLEVYKDLDNVRVITYSTLSEAKKSAQAIMKHKLEEPNTYCMIWENKNLLDCFE